MTPTGVAVSAEVAHMTEQGEQIHDLQRELVQAMAAWSGVADLKKLEFSSHFNVQGLGENRGEVVLQLTGNAFDVEMKWAIDEMGMAQIRRLRRESERTSNASAAAKQGDKWTFFDALLNRVLAARMMIHVSETLQYHGRLRKGTFKAASSILDFLNTGVDSCFADLQSKLADDEGTEYLRWLLRSDNDVLVWIGLQLVQGSAAAAALEPEVAQVSKNLGLPADVRRMAAATLTPETRQALQRSRRGRGRSAATAQQAGGR